MADKKLYLQKEKENKYSEAKDISSKKTSNVVQVAFNSAKGSVMSNAAKKNTNGSDDDDFQTKIRRHRTKMVVIICACIILFVIIAAVIWNILDNMEYSGYTILKSVNREDTETAEYIDYNNGYIRYSNDGIAYYAKNGTVVWNKTYEMTNPQVKICNNAVAVGDINGSSLYLFDETGMVGNSVDTSLPISQIEVSSQGLVAAVLEDVDANYINLYDLDGEKTEIYTVKTVLEKDGYPLDISISEDATKLVASFMYVDGDSIKTNVVFYNFSPVGQNMTNRVVGGFNNYESTIVPEVKFVNETCAIAIGENIMSIYKIKEYPSLQKEISIDGEIDRVFISDSYIGMVLKNGDSGDIYKMVVYDIAGKLMFEKTFNTEYKIIKFDGKSIIMYNDTIFTLLNIKGRTQLEQTFDLPIESILSLGSKGNYILISSKYIQEIKLK